MLRECPESDRGIPVGDRAAIGGEKRQALFVLSLGRAAATELQRFVPLTAAGPPQG